MNAISRFCVMIVLSLFCATQVGADEVEISDRLTIHNQTPRDLYIAIYYIGMKLPFMDQPVAKRVTTPQLLETQSSGIISRPVRKVGYDRELVFVEDPALLKSELSKADLDRYHSKNVGYLQGDVFYIGDKEGEFYGYTTVEWNVVKSIIEAARKKVTDGVPQIVDNPYKSTAASVRQGNQLSQGERDFLAQRMPRVKKQIEKLLKRNIPDNAVPKVAIVCSGGGYRAMLFTIGALLGAENSGILDATTYMVGLSGSTWGIGGWVLSGKPLRNYHDWLVNNINSGLARLTSDDVKLIGDHLLAKYFYDQPMDIVDLYGGLLANELFVEYDGRKQRQTLSSQAERIRSGSLPFPIYSAIAAENLVAENLWYEFNPYEVGSAWQGLYIPSWSFGRKFKNGNSVNFAPEQNFGVLMGTFGLAIGLTIDRLIKETGLMSKINSTIVKNIIDRILEDHRERRLTSSDFFNYSYDMSSSALRTQRILPMVDAGINFNLPYPIISGDRPERKVNIIIFVDASGDNLSADLKMASEYARKKGYKFPAVDYTNIDKRAVSVFKDEKDPSVPVVIYIPRILEKGLFIDPRMAKIVKEFESMRSFDMEACVASGPCKTFNFKYTDSQARSVTSIGIINMMSAAEQFVQALNFKVNQIAGAA